MKREKACYRSLFLCRKGEPALSPYLYAYHDVKRGRGKKRAQAGAADPPKLPLIAGVGAPAPPKSGDYAI